MAKKKASTHAPRLRTDSDAEAASELAASASSASDTKADLVSFGRETVNENLTESPSAGEFSLERDSAIASLLNHKVELESQIRRLLQNQQDLKASEPRYFDLFDLAPVGYLTLRSSLCDSGSKSRGGSDASSGTFTAGGTAADSFSVCGRSQSVFRNVSADFCNGTSADGRDSATTKR
jgi:hypothetical protein